MTTYVSVDSKNPIKDAVSNFDGSGYHTDPSGREYYFEANEDGKSFRQIFCDNDEVIEWGAGEPGKITPSNKIEVSFSC